MTINATFPEPPLSREVQEARRFYLNLPSDSSTLLHVISGGWEKCSPEYRVQRTDFPYFCVEFVADGKGSLELLNETHSLQRGAIFAYGPGCPHLIETNPVELLSKYYVDFVGAPALELMKFCNLSPGSCLQIGHWDIVQSAFDQIISSGRQLRKHSAKIVALELEILLLKIAEAVPFQSESQQSHQTFLRCRNYLDIHFLDLHSAMEVASKCHVGAEYLSRLFARYSTDTLYRYLLRKKMAYAAEMLECGHLIVREVAEKLEMDPFQFSRTFKRIHGQSPANFGRRKYGRVTSLEISKT